MNHCIEKESLNIPELNEVKKLRKYKSFPRKFKTIHLTSLSKGGKLIEFSGSLSRRVQS